MNEKTVQQLIAIGEVHALLDQERIEHWLFGGWAVDFHSGSATRSHDDIDLAVWSKNLSHITVLLESAGWRHAPTQDEDGGSGYERGTVRLELTYLVRDEDGRIYTPLRQGRASWSRQALGRDILELAGVQCCIVGLASLTRSKSSPRPDPGDAAKDRADIGVLSQVKSKE